jgi:hypothetical protein
LEREKGDIELIAGFLHPFGRAKPGLSRRSKETKLRVNLEPLGLSLSTGPRP